MILPLLVLLAAPRFDTSTIAASRSTIQPLETIDYTITIRNTGDVAPSYLRVANPIPTSALFAGGSPDWTFVEADRELSWMGTIPPGATKVLTLSLVTRPESAGLTLANRAALHYDGAFRALDHDLEIDPPPSTNDATLIVLAFLGISAVSLFLVRRGAMWMIVISGGFLLFFVDLARRDLRVSSDYAPAQCVVLDSMARYQASQAARSRKPAGTWSPLFALRYATTNGELVSVSFASESRFQLLPRGATAPCWYDPEEPKKVVLTRDLGGAYAFALIPLATLALGIAMLRRNAGVPAG